MKFLNLLCLTSLAICLTQKSFAGAGAHGGNLNPGKPVSVETVKRYLENIQVPVELSYKFMSVAYYTISQGYFGTLGSKDALATGKLLYPNAHPDIFDKIRQVKPTIVTDGSCKIDGVSEDGAAYTNPDRVCLDAARIAANPKVGDLDMALVSIALAAHEYSHLVGTSEDQANLIQDHIQEDISERLAEKYAIFVYSLNRRLDSVKTAFETVQNDVDSRVEWAQVCMDLTLAIDSFGNTMINSHDNANGIGFFSRGEFNEIIPYLYLASTFEFACKKDAATNQLRDYVFGSQKSVSDVEYVKRRFPKYTGNIFTGASIPRMDYRDAQAVSRDVEELKEMTLRMKSYLPKIR